METLGSFTKAPKLGVVAIGVLASLSLIVLRNIKGPTGQTRVEQSGGVARTALRLTGANNHSNWTEAYAKLPLSFEENQGQTARPVRFISHGSGYELFLTPQEAVLALSNPVRLDLSPRHRFATLLALRKARQASQTQQLTAVRLRFEGANPEPQIVGTGEMPGKVNYFIGNDPKKWHTDVPTYTQVKYTNVYSGIDLVFYGNQRRLEYDFIIAPGANPRAIRLDVEGARKLRVNANGDLVLAVGSRKLEFQKPVVYQQVNGQRHEIAGRYALADDHRVTFAVGNYDRSEPLILDPVLNFSTYLGGSSDDIGLAIAVDGNHNVVVAGTSTSTNFPTTSNAFMPQPLASNAGGAAFVTEINPTGTQLVYSTYLAGSTPAETANGVAVDPSGKIYVTGETASSDFPTNSTVAPLKPGPNPANANVGTSFLTKLDPAALTGAASLVYSSYIGGPNGDFGTGVAADSSGNAYVTGFTISPPGSGGAINNLADFPVTAGAIQAFLSNTNGNAFLTRIDTTQSGNASLIYSTYLGGNGANAAALGFGDQALGVAVDTSSNAYLVGTTSSTDFPTTSNAFQQNTSPPAAVAKGTTFISRINTTAGSLVYSSYLGGEDSEFGTAIALGPNNVAYLTGSTTSLTFPTTSGAFQAMSPTPTANTEHAFIGLIDTGQVGSASRTYATYLGGNNVDTGNGIQADALGNAYVAGSTVSAQFPTTPGAFQPVYPGAQSDGFVTELNPGGKGNADLIYSTFFGGSSAAGHDLAQGIALDTTNNVYITGQTVSSDFPVFPKPGAFQTSLNGTSDAFIAKLTLIPTLVVSPTTLNFGSVQIGTANPPTLPVTLTNNTNASIAFTSAAVSGGSPAAANTDYTVSANTCTGGIPAGASPANQCTVTVKFNPTVVGMETATLKLTDGDSTSPQSVTLSGTGANPTPAVGLAPSTLTFGNQVVNTTSAAQNVTLTNTGTGPLTINSISASGDFAETSTGASACPISPATLAAGANCTISVTFTPTATGARMGTLTVTDNAAGSPHTVSLTGTGSNAPDFTLTAMPNALTVAQGAVGTQVTISVNPTNGFASAVALTCTGAPANSSCVLNPTSITSPTTSTLTFTAHAMLVPLPISKPAPPLSLLRIVPLFVALMLLFVLRSTRRLGTRLSMVSAIVICLTLAACSGTGGPAKTAKGTYPLTVTGTSGTLSHNTTVTVTVN
jgi:ASPM-SPD-2-Hydin domain-containing protein/beta-propeller repeat-containing protein/centrosomal CEP192-like protein